MLVLASLLLCFRDEMPREHQGPIKSTDISRGGCLKPVLKCLLIYDVNDRGHDGAPVSGYRVYKGLQPTFNGENAVNSLRGGDLYIHATLDFLGIFFNLVYKSNCYVVIKYSQVSLYFVFKLFNLKS